MSILFAIWLLPGCILVQWVMARRQVRGGKAALRVAILASLLACGTLLPFLLILAAWPPSTADWLRRVPSAIEGISFILVWFTLFDRLSPQATAGIPDPLVEGDPPTASQRSGRQRFAEAIALVAAIAWTAMLGFAGGMVMDFGGDGEYRLESTQDSPGKTMRACTVSFFEPGGVLGGIDAQVDVLPATETWSARHRGLLLWQAHAHGVYISGVDWESERALRIRTSDSEYRTAKDASAFSRQGFTARTVVDPSQ